VIARNPIDGFIVIRNIVEKILMQEYIINWYYVACKYQDIAYRHQRICNKKCFVCGELEVEVGAVLDFYFHIYSKE
jgi:hypothetical protein